MKKKIQQNYGADLCWVKSFSEKFDAELDGNFIKVPNEIMTGYKYVLECVEGIVALYIDATYHFDFKLNIKNFDDEFVSIFYNLSKGEIKINYNNTSRNIGALTYDLFIIDSSLEYEYDISSEIEYFMLCIFIKKELLQKYFEKGLFFGNEIDNIFNREINTLVKFDRMSNCSFQLLCELRKKKVGSKGFDLNLRGTIYLLLSEYFNKLITNKNVIVQLVNEHDLFGIIEAQHFLLDNIKNAYPGSKVIAQRVNMSESKFNTLFKKVTGTSPNTFFMDNKLIRAKEFLETKKYCVADVSRQFSFIDSSYFAGHFKKKFGINPKKFIQKL